MLNTTTNKKHPARAGVKSRFFSGKNLKTILTAIILMLAFQITNGQEYIFEAMKAPLNDMLNKYLQIENALVRGNTEEAGKFADELNTLSKTVEVCGLTQQQLKIFNKEYRNILRNTASIRNANNYSKQCKHFENLTDNFYRLLKTFRFNNSIVYYNFTADADAYWLTGKSTMENPYFKGQKRNTDKQTEVLQVQKEEVMK